MKKGREVLSLTIGLKMILYYKKYRPHKYEAGMKWNVRFGLSDQNFLTVDNVDALGKIV